MDQRLIVGIAIILGAVAGYFLTPKPEPATELQLEYAKLKEHARMTDSLLQVAMAQTEEDSIALEAALMHLREAEAKTSQIEKKYEKIHVNVRALPPAAQDSFLRTRLPTENPYR